MAKLLVLFFLAVTTARVSGSIYNHTESFEPIPYNTPFEIKNFPATVRFVGRSFYNVTIIPTRGCVAFGVLRDAEDAITDFQSAQEYALLCPLFDEYAKEEIIVDNLYKVQYEFFDNESTIATDLQADITEAGDYLLDYEPVVEWGFLVTWNDARLANLSCEDPCDIASPRNTFQIAVAVVSQTEHPERPNYSFASFTYSKIEQLTSITRVGIVYGDNKGFQQLPFASNTDFIYSFLASKSTIISKPGRYIYDITDEPQRIGCLDLVGVNSFGSPEPLTVSTKTADMFGGTIVRTQGQCATSEEVNTVAVSCVFTERDATTGLASVAAVARYYSPYTVVCITPRSDLGPSFIIVSLESANDSISLSNNFYFGAMSANSAEVQITSGTNYLEENIAGNITLTWQESVFGGVFVRILDVYLVAYKVENDIIISKNFSIGTVARDAGSYEVDTTKTCGSSDDSCNGYLIGHFVLQVLDYDTPIDKYYASKVAISSMPIPIGWYVRNYHRANYGNTWFRQYCQPNIIPNVQQQCPCSRDLARYDTRTFSPAPDCLLDNGRLSSCQLQGASGTYCYSGNPLGSQGIRCCYNSTGDLIYNNDNPLTGSYVLPVAPFVNYKLFGITGTRTLLSYYLTHVKNFYSCCTAQGLTAPKSAQCSRFASLGQVSRCVDHKPSVFAAVAGDPHFQMPDGQTYTFNGFGEYWYVNSTDDQELKIQIRLGQAIARASPTDPLKTVNATVVKAFALRVGVNTVQVQVQPLSYLLEDVQKSKRLMILVNEEEQYWSEDQQVRFYDDFRIASSGVNQDFFHITLLNDGALVACDYIETIEADKAQSPGSMNCRISYSSERVQSAVGLLGRKVNNEYKLVNRSEATAENPASADLTDLISVNNFAETWKIQEAESLFTYVGTTFSQVNENPSYSPILNLKPDYITGDGSVPDGTDSREPEESVVPPVKSAAIDNETCSVDEKYSPLCSYDYRVTGSTVLANSSKQFLEDTDTVRAAVSAPQNFCPALNLPYTTFKKTNGNRPDSVATVEGCVQGYVPVGSIDFPFELICNGTTNEWGPVESLTAACVRSSLYDTTNADELEDPYMNATAVNLGMTDFSAVYLGRSLKGIKAYTKLGCIVLSSTAEDGYEPMICPLAALHGSKPATGVTENYKFFYQVVTAEDTFGLLSEIAADIKEAGQSLDSTYRDNGIRTAYIFTWSEVTHEGACTTTATCAAARRNSYQVAIAVTATDQAYAVVNYGKIQWSGLQQPGSNPSLFSFAGFYYGDRKGSLGLPYSNSTTAQIAELVNSGTLLSLRGRYIFDISSFPNPKRLGCYSTTDNLPGQQQLTLKTSTFDLFGGNVVRFQGSCLSTVADTWCAFERKTSTVSTWTFTPVYYIDVYTGVCVTPRTPQIDAGWTRLGLTTDNGATVGYVSDVYFGTELSGGQIGQLEFENPLDKFWLSAQPNSPIRIRWFGQQAFGSPENVRVELHVVGYNANGTTYDFPTIANARMADSRITIPTPLPQCNQTECRDILIGQLILSVVSDDKEDAITRTAISRLVVSTPLLPVGWYTNQYHTTLFGASWYQQYCDSSIGRLAVDTLPQCPCTRSAAIYEERVFYEAPDCYSPLGVIVPRESCFLNVNARKCYTTLPTTRGHSLRCCYDLNDNLIHPQSSPLDGSYLLPDAVNTNYQVFNVAGTNALLSYYQSHVKNMFACCSASINQNNAIPASCSALAYNRAASKTCGGFPFSYWTAAVGDPHFVTFDGAKYTFNGIGEFWYVYSSEPNFNTKIQVRITKAQNESFTNVQAGVLSAIALEYRGSRVEIHVQPLSFRQAGSKYLSVLVNGKEQFWNNVVEEQLQANFKIRTLDNQFYVYVNAMDNGPYVYCTYYDTSSLQSFGGMTCQVSVPNNYRRNIYGLGGFADEDAENDLVTRPKIGPWDVEFVDPTNLTAVHYTFGVSWNVAKTESLFTYFDDSWELFNSELLTYEPVLNLPPNLGIITEAAINATCGTGVNRVRCQYDYELTGSSILASRTRANLDSFDRDRSRVDQLNTPFCDYLDLAYASVTFPDGYAVGSTAVVSACLAGSVQTGTLPAMFVCKQEGDLRPTWSPAPTSLCRSSNNILGQQVDAVPVDPFNPTMPDYTLPDRVIRAPGITFGGRQITGFSIIAKHGCVALQAAVTDASIEGFPANITDVPLLCPLFASYAISGSIADTYKILFKQIDGQSPLLSEILLDIKITSMDLDPLVEQAEITNAYVFTWENARSSDTSCTDAATCATARRNTYEVVLVVTNQLQTYAIFNYKNITWSFLQGAANPTTSSFAAINYGDSRGTVYLPYKETSDLGKLATLGTVKGVNGRFIYLVTDRFQRLGCLNLPSDYPTSLLEPVTINTYVGDVYGSRRLVVQSACLPDNVENWICGYRKSIANMKVWLAKSKVYRLSDYSAACSSPKLPDVDFGEWDLTVVPNPNVTSSRYWSKIYLAESIDDATPVKLNDTLNWFSAEPSGDLSILWQPFWFENKAISLNVSVALFRPAAEDKFDRREIHIGVAENLETAFVFRPNDYLCTGDCAGYLVGQVVLRVANESIIYDPSIRYTEIASSLVPTGWLVNRYYTESTGSKTWYYSYCNATAVNVATKCPCTGTIAEADKRTFIAAPGCDDIFGSECLLSPASTKCYTTLAQNIAGNGLLCCYDKDDTLIYGQDEPFGGSYALEYAPSASDSVFSVTGAKAYLSYYYGHTKNLFACCTANPSNFANPWCYAYTEARSVNKKCTDYESSGVSGIVGDPHVLTPDNTIYSFNGVGEYWWVYAEANAEYQRPVRVQVRFQNKFKSSATNVPSSSIKASLLTAIAINHTDATIQVELQGSSYQFGSGRKLAVFVNNVEKIFSDHPVDQYYGAARIESSSAQDFIRINLPLNGPSIECTYVSLVDSSQIGSMSCTTYLTPAYKLKAHGLVGKYDGSASNDLIKRPDIALPSPTATDPTNLAAVHDFGKTWRVSANEAYFDYFGTSFEEINRDIDSFEPPFTLTPSTTFNLTDLNLVCPVSDRFKEQCEYDYRITGSRTLATQTRASLGNVRSSQLALVVQTGFCPLLELPYTRKTLSQNIRVNSVATIIGCLEGYVRNPAVTTTSYRCASSSGRADWTPTPANNTCILPTTDAAVPTTSGPVTDVPTTSGSATGGPATSGSATGGPATSGQATGGPATSGQATGGPAVPTTSQIPASNDATVEIILGVLLGVAVVGIIGLVAFYFLSIAPKISQLSAIAPAPASVELAGVSTGVTSGGAGSSKL